MKSYSIILIFLFVLNSCCTKKDCGVVINMPELYINFLNFEQEDYEDAKLYVVDNNTFLVLNEINIPPQTENKYIIFKPLSIENIEKYKEIAYIIATKTSNDTILNVDFLQTESKIKCNTCFLADGRADAIEFTNFSFYHNRKKISNKNYIIIEK